MRAERVVTLGTKKLENRSGCGGGPAHPQLESILANRKRDLGIHIESGRRLGLELAFNHGIDLGRRRGIGL